MLVRPIHAFNSTLPGVPGGVILSPADVLRDDNPHVKARPELFEEVRVTFHGTVGIEEATSRPGEKRAR